MTINISPKTPNSIFTPSEVKAVYCAALVLVGLLVVYHETLGFVASPGSLVVPAHATVSSVNRPAAPATAEAAQVGVATGGAAVMMSVTSAGFVTRVVYTLGIAGWFTGNSSEGCKKTRKHQLSSILPEMGPTNCWVCQIILESSLEESSCHCFLL